MGGGLLAAALGWRAAMWLLPGGAALLHLSFSPPIPNQQPVVDAGPARAILVGQQASLAGPASQPRSGKS